MASYLDVSGRPDGVAFKVRASPGASRDRVIGLHGDALKVAVTVAPDKGKSNKAILALLADTLGVSPGTLELIAGQTSRDKRVLVRGMTCEEVITRLGVH